MKGASRVSSMDAYVSEHIADFPNSYEHQS